MRSADNPRSTGMKTMFRRFAGTSAALLFLSCLVLTPLAGGQSAQATVDRVIADPRVKAAEQFIDTDHDRIVREIIALTEIEAPPFKEFQRANAFMQLLKDYGLTNVEMDQEGNVTGLRKGSRGAPLVAIAAHLDTVFPAETEIKVRR